MKIPRACFLIAALHFGCSAPPDVVSDAGLIVPGGDAGADDSGTPDAGHTGNWVEGELGFVVRGAHVRLTNRTGDGLKQMSLLLTNQETSCTGGLIDAGTDPVRNELEISFVRDPIDAGSYPTIDAFNVGTVPPVYSQVVAFNELRTAPQLPDGGAGSRIVYSGRASTGSAVVDSYEFVDDGGFANYIPRFTGHFSVEMPLNDGGTSHLEGGLEYHCP